MATEIAFCGMRQKNQLFQKLHLVEWDKPTNCSRNCIKWNGTKKHNVKTNCKNLWEEKQQIVK